MSLLATAQLVKKALGSNPAFLQGVENILFLLIQGTFRSPSNSRMRTESLARLCFVSEVCRVKQCYGSGMFIPDPDFSPSRIPGLGSQISDPGSRIQDLGYRIPDLGSRIRISGSRIPDPGSNNNKRGGRGKNCCFWVPFCSRKHSKLKIFHF